jgi:lysophospholipase L1-like esterase
MKKKLFLLVVSTLLSVLLGEFFLRVFQPFGFRLKGNKIILPTNSRTVYEIANAKKLDRFVLNTRNSLGFRGEDPPHNFLRYLSIVTIGGSTTECIALTDEETWTEVLGKLLEQNLENVWVNNAGLDGHSTFGHTILMKDYIVPIRPKVAMFLVGINDAYLRSANKYDKEVGYTTRAIRTVKDKLEILAEKSEVVSLILNMYRYHLAQKAGLAVGTRIDFSSLQQENVSMLLDKEVDYRILGTSATSQEKSDQVLADHKEYLDEYASRLREIIEIARRSGIEPIFVTQPAIYGDAIDDVTGIDLSTIVLANGNGEWGDGMTGKLKWEILELYNQTTREVGKSEGVFVVDLAIEMPKSSRYFYDYVHFTPEGAEKVAKILYKNLCPHFAHEYPDDIIQDCTSAN